jgi:DNA repair exonuclease SbcCD ATPase subunit
VDKNNRSLEKIKKFGDKLKDDLDAFVKERTLKLEESTIALNVEQTKAVAAVKRLEGIRDDLAQKEALLLERTKAVEGFGKQISSYDATIKKLLEMTALAETNLSKITAESDFADSLGKKLALSQTQLAEISAAIPAMRKSFEDANRSQLAGVQSETLAQVSRTVSELESRVETAYKNGNELLASTAEKFKELYQKSHAEAARRADALEDSSFAKLKEQATERLAKYRETIEEKTQALHEQTKERLLETQQLLKNFKADWNAEAAEYLEETRSAMQEHEQHNSDSVGRLEERLRAAEKLVDSRAGKIEAAVTETTAAVEARLDAYKQDVDYRLAQFDKFIADTERLDGQLRVSMQETEKRVTGEFTLYTQDQQSRLDAFSKKLLGEAEGLTARMQTLESGLNELKSRAYENVSARLKIFEDDFFADIAKRSDAINAALEHWKTNVDERLESLSAESESARKDVEAAHTLQLKERLAEIGEQYRSQTAKLEEQITSVEGELRQRITASDQSILAFVEQFRAEFAQARETAANHTKNELDAHSLSVQEILRKQEREVEARTKEFVASIDSAKTESETVLESIRNGFGAWQTRNEQQIAEAKAFLSDKVDSLSSSTTAAITDLESKYQSNYREFIAKTTEERKQYKEELDSLKKDIAQANAEFDKRSTEALAGFSSAYEAMSNGAEKRVRETATETDQTVRALKAMIQEIRESMEQTKDKLFQKIQGDSASLAQTLEEIDKKQKGFIAQTKIFERADDLKVALEGDIENIKNEISRLDVYRDTMTTLEQQYGKIRKLEEDVSQKVSRFMSEKKRIDILEIDFNKLLGLSDSISKQMGELTLTNDDLQQYQVQIRRFEESVADVNTRYERLEKKAVVLDQTVLGIDKAFENLKTLESSMHAYRENISGMPEELETIKRNISSLLENKDKTNLIVEKLSNLDMVLEDVEKRTEKMQVAREWLARTETRLEEISKQSQDQLKLLGDIMKDDGTAKKAKGAPPIGIRENVVKLTHQGWKVDEIARALHLSRGEVELILELPQK